jgi:hypothetical protein
LERIKRVVRLGGFVNVTAGYTAIAPVMNGCSDFIVRLRHCTFNVFDVNVRAGQSLGGKGPPRSRGCWYNQRAMFLASPFHYVSYFVPGVFELPLGAVVEVHFHSDGCWPRVCNAAAG